MLQFLIVRSKGLSRVSSSGIRATADFSPPFSQISPASSALPIPSLLGAGLTACKDESEVNWAQSDIEEEEELEEIALEPDFNYSTCNWWQENLRQTIQHTAASIPRRMPPPSGTGPQRFNWGLHDPPLARTWGTHLLLQLWVPYPKATISAPLADSWKGHPLSRSCGCCRQRVWHDVLFSQPPQQKRHRMLRCQGLRQCAQGIQQAPPSAFHPLPAEAKVRPAQDCRAVIMFLSG